MARGSASSWTGTWSPATRCCGHDRGRGHRRGRRHRAGGRRPAARPTGTRSPASTGTTGPTTGVDRAGGRRDRRDGGGDAMAAAATALGGIDVLVTCAGRTAGEPAHVTTLADWHAVLDANLTSAFLCARAVLPVMMAAGRGVIVTLGSVHGRLAAPGLPAYAAAKAGLVGLTRQLAVDYGQHGIRAVSVSPGWVRTADTESRLTGGRGRRTGCATRYRWPSWPRPPTWRRPCPIWSVRPPGWSPAPTSSSTAGPPRSRAPACCGRPSGPGSACRHCPRPNPSGRTVMVFEELLAGRPLVAVLRGVPAERRWRSPTRSGTAASAWSR